MKKLEEVLEMRTLVKLKEEMNEIEELVIVIDAINGFMVKGNLASPHIYHIVDGIADVLESTKNKKGVKKVFVQDYHSEDSTEFNVFLEHCKGDSESEIVDRLKPYVPGSLVFRKNSRNFMFAPGVIDLLFRLKNLKRVRLMGCCSDKCLVKEGAIPLINFFHELNRDVEVIVHEDLMDTYDYPGHEREMYNKISSDLMEQEGVKLVKTIGGVNNGK